MNGDPVTPLSTDDRIPLPTARTECPLCAWHYDIPELPAGVGPDTLAGVFGPGIMLQHAINRRLEETEKALRTHLETHKLEEWVKKVSSLKHELMLARAVLDGAFV